MIHCKGRYAGSTIAPKSTKPLKRLSEKARRMRRRLTKLAGRGRGSVHRPEPTFEPTTPAEMPPRREEREELEETRKKTAIYLHERMAEEARKIMREAVEKKEKENKEKENERRAGTVADLGRIPKKQGKEVRNLNYPQSPLESDEDMDTDSKGAQNELLSYLFQDPEARATREVEPSGSRDQSNLPIEKGPRVGLLERDEERAPAVTPPAPVRSRSASRRRLSPPPQATKIPLETPRHSVPGSNGQDKEEGGKKALGGP